MAWEVDSAEPDWCIPEGNHDPYPPLSEVTVITKNPKRQEESPQIETIDGHLESYNNVADKALEWSSKKPYLQDLFAGWLEGVDLSTQSKLVRDTKRKWWQLTQSPDIVRKELSQAIFGAVAIAMNGPMDWSHEKMRSPTFPLTLLLQHGADPSALSDPGPDGGTALHWLADMAPHDDKDSAELRARQVTLGKILLDHGADVNARMGENMDRCTPLHKACSSRAGVNIPFIDLLLENGANVNALSMAGWTFLMYSVPFNINGAWHVLTAAEKRLNPQFFIYEIEEAMVKERIEYLKLKYDLTEEIVNMLVMILGELKTDLEKRTQEGSKEPSAKVVTV